MAPSEDTLARHYSDPLHDLKQSSADRHFAKAVGQFFTAAEIFALTDGFGVVAAIPPFLSGAVNLGLGISEDFASLSGTVLDTKRADTALGAADPFSLPGIALGMAAGFSFEGAAKVANTLSTAKSTAQFFQTLDPLEALQALDQGYDRCIDAPDTGEDTKQWNFTDHTGGAKDSTGEGSHNNNGEKNEFEDDRSWD